MSAIICWKGGFFLARKGEMGDLLQDWGPRKRYLTSTEGRGEQACYYRGRKPLAYNLREGRLHGPTREKGKRRRAIATSKGKDALFVFSTWKASGTRVAVRLRRARRKKGGRREGGGGRRILVRRGRRGKRR